MRADRFRDLKAKEGYSRKKLAMLLDISESNIPRYESGDQLPSSETLKKMAQLFNVTSDYLIGLTDDPSTSIWETNLDRDELKTLTLLRETTPENRQKIIGVLQIMTDHGSAGV